MDRDAFERTVHEHKDRLYAYARSMLRDAAEAQDAVQESLIRLWRHRDGVDEAGARVWLMRTAHNLCIDGIRKRRVRAEVADGEAALGREEHPDPGPLDCAASGELGRSIARCLGSLGPDDREVLVLREVQGLPYDEIASMLGVPLGTLKARLHRAREKLRARLCRAGVMP